LVSFVWWFGEETGDEEGRAVGRRFASAPATLPLPPFPVYMAPSIIVAVRDLPLSLLLVELVRIEVTCNPWRRTATYLTGIACIG